MSALELSSEQYHADEIGDTPTLSASLAHILTTASPAHARAAHPRLNPDFERATEERFDLGTVVHALLLQGDDIADVMPYPDWRTANAKADRDATRAAGRIPLLTKDYVNVRRMVDATRARLDELGIAFTPGWVERTLAWEMNGVACRARLDWLSPDATEILDLKTAGRTANPESWSRTLFSIGADLQHEFYRRGVEAVYGEKPSFTFIVVECEPPYALSRVSLAPSSEEFANAKVDYALAKWKQCLTRNEWPAYPTDIAYVEMPGWEASRWMEREAREGSL